MIAIRGMEEAKDMAEGERATGTPNTSYDLSSVLFHALEGGASYDTYIEDAEREGDQELAEFFRQVRDEDSNRADRAQRLLAERTITAERTEGTTTGAAVAGTEGGPPESAERVDPLGREDRLPREERAALGREDRLPTEERARETEREEDKGLLDKALDKLSGRGDKQGRREEQRRER